MELRTAASPRDVKHYTTERLREEFLAEHLFEKGEIRLIYSHIDRIIFGAAVPAGDPLKLEAGDELRAKYFLERREMGMINIGGPGKVTADGTVYEIASRDGLYIGMGTKDIFFASDDPENPAKFYICSGPAHRTCPTKRVLAQGPAVMDYDVVILPENNKELGTLEDSNHRTIHKYILPGQVESCQLEMGMTHLEPGSVWNTCPATPMTDAWRSISTLTCPRMLSLCITWASPQRPGTSWSATSRPLFLPPGPFIRAQAPGTIPSSGAWSARTRISTTWTRSACRI
jgi:4-deoxy-L-threo-5-hexosulose-uronate ketol-isomerase